MCVVVKQGVGHRWGYKHVEELADVVANYKAADIPLEVMWTDIDYMDGYRDFSLDPNNFSKDKMQASPHVCVAAAAAAACAVYLCMQRWDVLLHPCCQACNRDQQSDVANRTPQPASSCTAGHCLAACYKQN